MSQPTAETVRVIDSNGNLPELPLVEGKGYAKVVLWPGNGAKFRTVQVFELLSGDRTVELTHSSDCVYGIIKGTGTVVDLDSGRSQELVEGAMLHIDASDRYRLVAGENGMTFLGGPCPPDPALYASLEHPGDKG